MARQILPARWYSCLLLEPSDEKLQSPDIIIVCGQNILAIDVPVFEWLVGNAARPAALIGLFWTCNEA